MSAAYLEQIWQSRVVPAKIHTYVYTIFNHLKVGKPTFEVGFMLLWNYQPVADLELGWVRW